MRYAMHDEWLETDGLGGFASGTVSGIRTRRYHALLLVATTPPAGRVVLVNGLEVFVTTPDGRFALSAQKYEPDVIYPDGHQRLGSFEAAPFPTWTWQLPGGGTVVQEVFTPKGHAATVVRWQIRGCPDARLEVRPLLSGRDYHATHHENAAFAFAADTSVEGRVAWSPYQGLPRIDVFTNGTYTAAPEWYRNFSYDDEQRRGLDHVEDLASPGVFTWREAEAVLVLAAERAGLPEGPGAVELASSLRARELARRKAFASPLHQAADAYIVARGAGRTIIAGYPWFTDWGRDTFIALRGLCLAGGREADARDILVEWAGAVSEGMLPNRFADAGDRPEFNAVDASLWYVVAVHELLERVGRRRILTGADRLRLNAAVEAIVAGYARGTRYGIRADVDGLLACGVPGVQLTWMDARVGERVITPRVGKPVEVQALWLNALRIAAPALPWAAPMLVRGLDSFAHRFPNDAGYLNDVVDVDHVAGTEDRTLRPNQVLALGGLPFAVLDGPAAASALAAVEARLLTPLGLRSLDPHDPAYVPHYGGGVAERDGAYHQGTAWPWLAGPFVDAWLRVHGRTDTTLRAARERFVTPLLAHLDHGGIGHVSEIADADPPYTPAGCPFQAWSLGELLRLETDILQPARQPSASLSAQLEVQS